MLIKSGLAALPRGRDFKVGSNSSGVNVRESNL